MQTFSTEQNQPPQQTVPIKFYSFIQQEPLDSRRNTNLKNDYSDYPFPTFNENYRQMQYQPTYPYTQSPKFSSQAPSFAFPSYEQPKYTPTYPTYDQRRPSQSSQPGTSFQQGSFHFDPVPAPVAQKKENATNFSKPNANDFFRNLESGKAVIKRVNKGQTERNEDVHYNCGELENDDDSLILGYINQKLKELPTDNYFCGTMQDDDDENVNQVAPVQGGRIFVEILIV